MPKKKVLHAQHIDGLVRCKALKVLECVRCDSKIPVGTLCLGYCTSKTGKWGYVICRACVSEDPSLEEHLNQL